MIEIKNTEIWGKVLAEEVAAVNGNRSLTTGETVRFVNALAKAAVRIEEQGCFMDYDRDADKLTIWSQGSNEIYEVSGDKTCQCKAFANGNVCWHRACHRLASRYLLAEKLEERIAYFESEGFSRSTAQDFAGAAAYLRQTEAQIAKDRIGQAISYDAGYGVTQ